MGRQPQVSTSSKKGLGRLNEIETTQESVSSQFRQNIHRVDVDSIRQQKQEAQDMNDNQEREALRAEFEAWYAENAFVYEKNPIGSRDCGLQWAAWQAARASQPSAPEVGAFLVPGVALPPLPAAELRLHDGGPSGARGYSGRAMQCYAAHYGQAVAAQSSAPAVPQGLKVERGFEWDGEALHHVPTLLVEFEPVPMNSPNTSKGWSDRDAVADMLTQQEPTRGQRMRDAGFTARDTRITCGECGLSCSPQFLAIHKCTEPTK